MSNPNDPPIPPISELKGAFHLNTEGLEHYDAIAGSIEEEANRVFGLLAEDDELQRGVDIPYMSVSLGDCKDYLPEGVALDDIDIYEVAHRLSEAFMEHWGLTLETVLRDLYGPTGEEL